MQEKIEYAEERVRVLTLIVEKAKEVNRMPVKADFTDEDIFLIKKHFGPIPRALEAAGIKEVSDRYLKRIKRRRKRRSES